MPAVFVTRGPAIVALPSQPDYNDNHTHTDTESEKDGNDSDDSSDTDRPLPPGHPAVAVSREVHAGLFQGALVGQQGRGSDGHMHRSLTGASRALQLDSVRGVSAQPRADGSTDVKSLDSKRIRGQGTFLHLDQDLGVSPATIPQSRSAATPATSAPSSAISSGSPQTREDLAKLLEGMEFGKKITKLEITLSISIQITRTIVKMSRSVAPHNTPAPVLVIHCTRLPDHKGVLATPELKRWEPVDVQPHRQQYLYIVSETKKITINVTFKLIKAEKK